MSFLEEPGDLAEVPLAAVLLEVMNQRASGVLSVTHGGGSSRVYFRAGVPVGAQSFTGFRPLGQVLLTAGLIDVEQLGASLAEMARSGRQQGDVLVDMGYVTRGQVDDALSEQQTAYLAQIAGLASGRFEFDPTAPVPAWTASVRISPFRAVVEALERPQSTPLVASALQPAASGTLGLEASYRQLAPDFGWRPAEAALVARLREGVTLDAFLADPGVPPERARAIVSALLLLGLAVVRRADGVRDSLYGQGVAAEPPATAGGARKRETLPAWDEASPTEAIPDATPATPPPAQAVPPPLPNAASHPTSPPVRRGDPEEARRRRQRLLQRAMQNMGVGPLSGQAPPGARQPPPLDPARAAAATAGARPAAPAAPEAARPGARPRPPAAEEELRRALEAALPRSGSADLFERLGLQRTATRDQVRTAYFQLAKQLHPDRFAAPSLADVAPQVKELFTAINEAYETLSDDRKRADYLARTSSERPAGAPFDHRGAEVDFQKAEACTKTRDFAKARGFYESALRGNPRPDYQVAYALAILQDPQGDRARARALAEAALREPSTADRGAYLCGLLARDEGDADRAERFLRRALQVNPRLVEAERELRVLEARRPRPKGRSGLAGIFRKG